MTGSKHCSTFDDGKLPYDVKVGDGVFRKGVSARLVVDKLHRDHESGVFAPGGYVEQLNNRLRDGPSFSDALARLRAGGGKMNKTCANNGA